MLAVGIELPQSCSGSATASVDRVGSTSITSENVFATVLP
jgi:hypothetical protein